MYQALYRKYRPSNFEEVVGQEIIVKTLENEIINNKLSHAYLFTGPRGTGKTSIAKIFAKTVNCEKPNGFLPCNECVSCTQINNKQTTDIIEIDAASNNGVDEIRELRSKVNLVPSNSKYKVYIIDEVHMLTTGAFNALLKTLEEPPKHIIFILATTDPHKVPTTILSRCQRFDFKRISDKKIVERLKLICENENIKIEPDALNEIARLSDGGMRDAISILDQVDNYASDTITLEDVHEVNGTLKSEEIKNIVSSLFNKQIDNIFKELDNSEETGKNFVKLTEEIIYFLRNMLLYKTAPNYFNELSQNNDYCNEEIPKLTLLNYIEKLNSTLIEMKTSNNPKMVLELAFINLLSTEETNEIQNKEIKEKLVQNMVEPIKKPSKEKPKIIEKTKEADKENSNYFPGNKIPEEKQQQLNELIELRINNTLSGFNKKNMLEFKKKEELLHTYLLNPDYSNYISMILDGNLKAFGNNYIIYVFPTKHATRVFNESLLQIDKLLKEVFNEEYHAVATDIDNWEKIKNEFNQKKKNYEFKEEAIDLKSLFENKEENNDNLQTLFGDIVEYQ